MSGFTVKDHLDRGLELLEAGRPDDAVAEYTSAIVLDAECFEGYFHRARAYVELRRYKEAIDDLSRLLDVNPAAIATRYLRGKAFEATDNFAGAAADFSVVIENYDPRHLDKEKLADSHLRRGNCLEETGKTAEALEDYSQAIAINPFWDCFFSRSRLLLALNRNDEAIADLNESIKREPRFPLQWYCRGLAHLRLGHLLEGFSDLKHFMELDTSDERVYPIFAEAALQLGIDELAASPGVVSPAAREYFLAAIAACDKALKMGVEQAKSHSIRANAHNNLREFDEAKRGFDQSIAIDATRPQAYYLRSVACMNLKDLEGARADLKKAAELFLEQGNTQWHQTCLAFLSELEENISSR